MDIQQHMQTAPVSRAIDLIPPEWGTKFYGSGVDIALTQTQENSIDFSVGSHFFLVLLTPQTQRQTRLASSRFEMFDASPGTIELIPSGSDFAASWRTPKENILLSVDPDHLNDLSVIEHDRVPPDLGPFLAGETDPVAHRIALLMRDGLLNDQENRLYLESLSIALLAHFIRRMAGIANAAGCDQLQGGLAPHIRNRLAEYMHENIHRSMSIDELSGLANMSYSHFLRAFRQTMGEPPHRFLMRLRAEQAQFAILNTGSSFKQISEMHGFSSQAHMTTAMRRFFNITPKEIRKSKL